MKKTFYPPIFIIILLMSCTKNSDYIKSDIYNKNVESIKSMITQFDNLSIDSIYIDSSLPLITTDQLSIFKDSLSELSILGKGILQIEDSSSTSNKLKILSNTKTSNLVSLADAIGHGTYAWSTSQKVGSSELGYYEIDYIASFGYSSPLPGVNTINTVSLSNPPVEVTVAGPGGTLYTYQYHFKYTPVTATYGLSAANQVCSLSFSGTAVITKVYVPIMGA
ncbi:MAG: hypothetical protein QM610_00855 [Chitinophagaceae bacterium]